MHGGRVVLVVGLAGEDSGKTLAAAGLVEALRGQGVDVVGSKPMAGVRLWAESWLVGEAERRGVLVSDDGLRLWSASGGTASVSVEAVNPVVVYHALPDPESVGFYLSRLPSWGTVILGRVSRCSSTGRVETLHFINTDLLRRLPETVEDAVLRVAVSLKPYPLKSNYELARKVLEGGYAGEARSCLERLAGEHEMVIVESNSDRALPLPGMRKPCMVVAVSPGRILLVDPDRYWRAVELKGAGSTVEEILSLAGVLEGLPLPLPSDLEREGVPSVFTGLASRIAGSCVE